ncbi:MAG: hypothetical protein NNA31_05965 [Nitrospira sp.]|nr:hypothetical protein [Nitrospira sp.]
MAAKPSANKPKLVKQIHTRRPDFNYFLLEPDHSAIKGLLKPQTFVKGCQRACTKIVTLLPKTEVAGRTEVGYQMINVDGYRTINAYVISDPLNGTTQRGFTLELSFSLHPFVSGVGVVGETSFFFNFDGYFEPGTLSHKTIQCETSDLTTTGGLPRIGGIDLAHILRTPVLGPYVRASVFNEDNTARHAEVRAYLST